MGKNKTHGILIYLPLFTISLLFHFSIVYAANYYVAPNGNDSNPGTISQPWQHIAYATCGGSYLCPITTNNPNKLQAGDTLYLRGGIYNENQILFTNSGSTGNSISLINYPNETPVVDGGFSNNLYPQSTMAVFKIDRNYITLDGLEILHGWRANILIGDNVTTIGNIIQNCNLHDLNANDNSGHIVLNHVDDVTIRKNRMHGIIFDPHATQQSGDGVFMHPSANYFLIENNEIYNVLQGVWAKYKQADLTKYPIIRLNLIHDLIQGTAASSNGLAINNVNTQVVGNLIYNVGYRGIKLGEGYACGAAGGINILVSHNTIINTFRGIEIMGTRDTDPMCGAHDNIIRDNIIYNFSNNEMRGLAIWPYHSTDLSNTTFDHNIIYSSSVSSPIMVLGSYYSTTSCPLTVCTNNSQSKPLFRKEGGKDYTLQPNSPGKKAGSDGKDIGANVGATGLYPANLPPSLPF